MFFPSPALIFDKFRIYISSFFWNQTYLQSLTVCLEEMRVERRDTAQWMHHRLLPQDLREQVWRNDQYKWLETRGVDEETLVQILPKYLRRDIKRHLCLNLVRRGKNKLSVMTVRNAHQISQFIRDLAKCLL